MPVDDLTEIVIARPRAIVASAAMRKANRKDLVHLKDLLDRSTDA